LLLHYFQWPGTSQDTKEIGESSFFVFNEGGAQVVKPAFVMPTIIRAKPRKPTAPKPTPTRAFFPRINYSGAPRLTPADETVSGKLYWEGDESPPMPSQPPPPPPPEYIAGLEEDLSVRRLGAIASVKADAPLTDKWR
jgi:hypothetical protein